MAAGSEMVKNPRVGSEITQDWLDHMLTTYERRRDPGAAVKVIKFEVKPGTKPGENVASELVKIWVEAKLTKGRKKKDVEEDNTKQEEEGQTDTTIPPPTTSSFTSSSSSSSSSSTTKEYNLMAKFNNGAEVDREFSRYTNSDLNELLIYSDVIDELNAFQERVAGGKYPVAVPEFVYGVCSGDESVLVMQDVSVLGYKTEDKFKGLDLPHTLMAAEHLARLHALSHAYHQTQNFLKRFPTLETNDGLTTLMVDFPLMIYENVVGILSERPELTHLQEKLRDNQDLMKSKLKEVVSRNSSRHKVICLAHGDAWTNNLMYRNREGPDGPVPEDLLLIDWGLLGWRNPILDLHQVVYNCTTLTFRREHLQEVLKRYHDTFTAATRDLGAPVANYGYQEFLKEWKRTSIFGFMSAGIFANSIVLSHRARESFVKGEMSAGIKHLILQGIAKILVPIIMSGWLSRPMLAAMKKQFQPVFDEVRSGANQTLNSTLIDILTEAYENGVLDQ